MRPLTLTMSAFTCFRETTEIDLRDLTVFGISGATGAGKTSILDAMMFALYGRVPRVGKSCAPLVSSGKERMSVSLVFSVAGHRYAAARALRRGGGSSAQLDDLDGGIKVAEGVRDVDRSVERLLGMPFETFTQAVVLPQGEFARFLASSPSERTKILRDLLRLDIYDRMRQKAVQRQKRSELAASILREQLEKHFARATEEHVASLEAARASDTSDHAACAELAERRRAELSELRVARSKTEALDLARGKRLALDEHTATIAEKRQELLLAVEAESHGARLERLEAAVHALDERRRAATLAAAAVERATSERGDIAADLRRAEEAAREATAIGDKIGALDRIAGDVAALARDSREQASLRARAEVEDATLGRLEAHLAAARVREERARAAADAARADLDRGTSDFARLAAIEEVGDLAREVDASERLADEKARELAVAEESLGAARSDEARKRAHAGACEAALATAERAREAARKALEKASHVEHVRHLRGELVVGKPCPVCEQEVASKPRLPRALEVEGPTAKREAAERAAREAADAALRARADVEHAERATGAAVAIVESASRACESAAAKRSTGRTALSARVESVAAELAPGATLAARVLATLELVRAKRRALEVTREKSDTAFRALHSTSADVAHAVAEAERQTERAGATRAAREALDARISATRARIAEVTTHADPARERSELVARRDALEGAVAAAKERERRAETRLLEARSGLGHAEREVEAARARHALVLAEVESALVGSSFDGIDAVRAAVLPALRQASLRAEVERFERARAAADDALALATTALASAPVSAAGLESGARRAEEAGRALDEAAKRLGAREQEIAAARADLTRARELSAELQRAERERATFAELATDLGTAEFQQHVQSALLSELVDHASVRLSRLSRDRYRLTMKDDEFWVVDEENAGAPRPAYTLSGGETFLASLALALSLSDQVQASSGAVRLESLFIDEGFGTLDVEALDVAAEAIESLEQGGRMVGIISHVRELNQRVRRELVVERGPRGSTVRTVT